jgi:lipoate-protein ligase A
MSETIAVEAYNLPDIHLLEKQTNQFLVWIPDKTYIVLGASNQLNEVLYAEKVIQDKITVLKRPSGGQTVVLTPNNLIISAVFFDKELLHPKEVFNNINMLIINVLEQSGINNLSLKGISDIAISGKKILGSSIYRSKNALLYHAVLNLSESVSTFEKYLKHPSKEPDYRLGRSHSEFVTSLSEKGFSDNYQQLASAISQSFETALFQNQ